MKTKIYRVRKHVRTRHARNFSREASSAEAIQFLNQVIMMARQELRLAKRVSVTGSISRRDVSKITFHSEFSSFSLDFREGVAV